MRTKYYVGSGYAIYAKYLRMKPFWRRSYKKIPKKVTLFWIAIQKQDLGLLLTFILQKQVA